MHVVHRQTGGTKPRASLKLRFHHGLKVKFWPDKVQPEPKPDATPSVRSHSCCRGWPRRRGVDTAHVPVEPRSSSVHWHSPSSSSQTGSHIPDLLIDSLTNHQPGSWSCPTQTSRTVLSRGAEPPESGLINTSSSFTNNTFFSALTSVYVSVFVVFLSSPHLCFIHHLLFWSAILSAPCHHSSHCTHVSTTGGNGNGKKDRKTWNKKKPLQTPPTPHSQQTDAKSATMQRLNGHVVVNRKKCCSINWLVVKLIWIKENINNSAYYLF